MHIAHTEPKQITSGPSHHGFTSCAYFQGIWYVSYRTAETHHPAPPGHLIIARASQMNAQTWHPTSLFLLHGKADLRDPRLLVHDDTLYCICAGYLPRYPRESIGSTSSENLIQSFLTYTTDGSHWAPLEPIGRPGYWIWSLLPLQRFFVAAAYHVGAPGETSSIHLLSGTSLLHLAPSGVIYDGASLAMDGDDYRYTHTIVAEPVLYQPTPDTLGCLLRTEAGASMADMEIGSAMHPYQDWRWHRTYETIHPSAVIQTPHGLLMAGRALVKETTWKAHTALWALDGLTVTKLLTFPSAYDTGYAGLCAGDTPDTFLCSFYSQHTTPAPYGYPLPGAQVFVSTLTVLP